MSNYLRTRNDNDLFDNRFFNALFGDDKEYRMKTDIVEMENGYELDVDLPGYNKEDVKINFEKGYLTVHAETKRQENDNNKKQNSFIRRERYYGEVTRSYYFGDEIKDELIKATFLNGVLKISVPKKDKQEVENKKYISIE